VRDDPSHETQATLRVVSRSRPNRMAMVDRLRRVIRNRLSRIVAAIRRSQRLQPLHRRYGPIKYRYLLPAWRRLAKLLGPASWLEPDNQVLYELWAERSERLRYNRNRALQDINRFTYRPTFSIILPIYNPESSFLRKALDSVLNQYYPHWDLCICDDASTAPHVAATLKEYAAKDERIKVAFSETNEGIARASNRALTLATGEFTGLLDHDDELTPDALYEVAATLQKVDADLIYSDEDRLDSQGRRSNPSFKPAWSPDLLLSRMYLAHFCVYRKSVVDQVGAFRQAFDGSQDYDLALRVTEATAKIAHIPRILYHWRTVPTSASALPQARPRVTDAGKRALEDALHRRGIDGYVETERAYGSYRVRRSMTGAGQVSIIIPTKDGLKRLRTCIDSIESKTEYRRFEIIIVDNGSSNAATLDYMKRSPHRVIRIDDVFNFSRLNNRAAQEARSDYLLFLNDDTEVIAGEWLSALLEHAQRPEVGAVGAKLLYPNGRIQHGGIVLGVAGSAGHAHRGVDGFNGTGYLNYPNLIRNYSAVTAACLMVRRDVFIDAGGFNEEGFPVSYNDVDLCLRLRERGYLIVYTPYALLYHHESATRGLNVYPKEEALLRMEWRSELTGDSYYNPNLTLVKEDFAVDFSKPEALTCILAQDSSTDAICILDNATQVGQEVFVEEDYLCAIAVRLRSMGRPGKGIVRMRIRELRSGNRDLRYSDVEASQVRDDEWCFFHFEPIRSSSGCRFQFFLGLLDGSDGVELTLLGSAGTIDLGGPHFRNHVPGSGTLAFRVYSLRQFRYAASSTAPAGGSI
jgi:O-antigen biosynthesis protein